MILSFVFYCDMNCHYCTAGGRRDAVVVGTYFAVGEGEPEQWVQDFRYRRLVYQAHLDQAIRLGMSGNSQFRFLGAQSSQG